MPLPGIGVHIRAASPPGTTKMTLKVTCPNCGARYTTEFWFGGELATHDGSGPSLEVDPLEDDFDRVWLKTNAAGLQRERWFHHAGCRRWFTVQRDTRSNAFHDRD
jgi:sarcosine oxidase, subunit delta